tara:strand:- start:65889 stop:66989 length:1101 start_codon:yes stop_codon:yes gene_type:complete
MRIGIIEADSQGKYFKVVGGAIHQRVRIIGKHGKSIPADIFKWIPLMVAAGLSHANTWNGALPPGTLVNVDQDSGQGDSTLGIINNVLQGIITPDGFKHLLQNDPRLVEMWNVLLTKGVGKTTVNGVEIYEIFEEVKNKLIDLAGLNSHGAIPLLMNNLIPDVKRIETALQSAASAMTADLQSLIPGNIFSLGQLKDLLTDSMKKEIFDAVPGDVGQVLNTLLNNIRSTSGDINGKRVNLPIFLANVVAELKDAKTVDELVEKFMKILQDESLSGMDLLGNIETEIEGAFGTIKLQIDSLGNITEIVDDVVSQAMSTFSSLLGSLPSVSGALFSNFNDVEAVMSRTSLETHGAINAMLAKIKLAPT